MQKHCGTQPRDMGQKPPAQVDKIPSHSDLAPQTTSPAFASQLTWVFDDCGPLLAPLSSQSAQEALVPK